MDLIGKISALGWKWEWSGQNLGFLNFLLIISYRSLGSCFLKILKCLSSSCPELFLRAFYQSLYKIFKLHLASLPLSIRPVLTCAPLLKPNPIKLSFFSNQNTILQRSLLNCNHQAPRLFWQVWTYSRWIESLLCS